MTELDNSLSPQLANIRAQLDAATANAGHLIGSLSTEQLKQRSNPNSWSVAECITHLSMTTREYLPILDEALERASREPSSTTSTLKMDLIGKILKWTLEPPYKMKVKTTAQFQPVEIGPLEDLLPTFNDLQEQLKRRIEKASSLAINKVKVTSPFNNRVKYNLFSAFNVLVAHERRHIWQAAQVRKAIGAQDVLESGVPPSRGHRFDSSNTTDIKQI